MTEGNSYIPSNYQTLHDSYCLLLKQKTNKMSKYVLESGLHYTTIIISNIVTKIGEESTNIHGRFMYENLRKIEYDIRTARS